MKLNINIDDAHNVPNLCGALDAEDVKELGMLLKIQIDADILSRSEWERRYDEWMLMAQQVAAPKNTPWPGASNVKYPALATAAMQFNARAYPSLFGNRAVFKGVPLGVSDENKVARAVRVGTFMSVQVNDLMPNWQEENDRMLLLLPIVGTVFKKMYHSAVKQTVMSELVEARNLIVNYHARDFETARKTHRMWMTHNRVISSTNLGLFRADVEFPNKEQEKEGAGDEIQGFENNSITDDPDAPYEVYECHCWLDLDEDGFSEPYVVTMFKENDEILRIAPRWDEAHGIQRVGDQNSVYNIVADEYFACYKFLPDPTSSIYGVGFGNLIGPTGQAIDTAINQLIDAGTLSVMQSGFVGRGTRLAKGGIMRFGPGEWKQVQTTGDDLRRAIMPLPAAEPSNVLFQLLGMLIETTQSVTSVQDMMQGKNPGQNQPYSTSKEVLEQGMKVFNGIYKRIYRSLSAEARILFNINRKHPNEQLYGQIIGKLGVGGAHEEDFSLDVDVIPSAEPDMINEVDKVMKNNGLLEKLQLGLGLNRAEVLRRMLESEGHEDIETLMDVQPVTPPEVKLEEQKFQHQQRVDMARLRIDQLAARDRALRDRANAIATIERIGIDADKADTANALAMLDGLDKERQDILKQMELEIAAVEAEAKVTAANKPAPSGE